MKGLITLFYQTSCHYNVNSHTYIKQIFGCLYNYKWFLFTYFQWLVMKSWKVKYMIPILTLLPEVCINLDWKYVRWAVKRIHYLCSTWYFANYDCNLHRCLYETVVTFLPSDSRYLSLVMLKTWYLKKWRNSHRNIHMWLQQEALDQHMMISPFNVCTFVKKTIRY